MRSLIPAGLAAALIVTGCHKKQQQVTLPPIPSPTQPRDVTTKPKRTRKAGETRQQPTTTAVRPSRPESPKLVDFLTDEQRQDYDREITASLQAAEENLSSYRQSGSPAKQKEADRVESLIRQSRHDRDSGDLTTARKLATMARVVSETLK